MDLPTKIVSHGVNLGGTRPDAASALGKSQGSPGEKDTETMYL